jgi:hypothetical protein
LSHQAASIPAITTRSPGASLDPPPLVEIARDEVEQRGPLLADDVALQRLERRLRARSAR